MKAGENQPPIQKGPEIVAGEPKPDMDAARGARGRAAKVELRSLGGENKPGQVKIDQAKGKWRKF